MCEILYLFNKLYTKISPLDYLHFGHPAPRIWSPAVYSKYTMLMVQYYVQNF